MRQILEPDKGIPSRLLWTLAVIAGLSVANLYYNQPLLNRISSELGVSEFTANLIPMCSQIGYACGLLFVIPLGDLYKRRNIIFTNFALLVIALLTIASSSHIHLILVASVVTGVCSVIPQIFIPIAAQFSVPEKKAQNVGIILSGLLTGILSSRVVSGIVGEYWGWRTIYYIAATLMFVCLILVGRILPDTSSTYRGSYAGLMKSIFTLVSRNATLRLVSVRAALCFGSFLCLWACMAFKMSGAPFYAGNNVIGLLGICGMAGAITASAGGRYLPKVGVKRFNYIGCSAVILSWLILLFGQNAYLGIIVGIVLIDIGMQCIQVSNQAYALSLEPRAANRINTIFMTTFFLGGSLGTFLAGACWQHFQWEGVAGVGLTLSVCSLLITIFSKH